VKEAPPGAPGCEAISLAKQYKAPNLHNPISQLKLSVVELLGLVFFLVLVTDTAVTELAPIIKHIWHTLMGL
jgi:hypothetical protein